MKDAWVADFKVYQIYSQVKNDFYSDDPLNEEEFDEEATLAYARA